MDTELLRRYGTPVPRYTSYPTAPQFHTGVTDTTYQDWLAGIADREPVSLYFHVPFCASMCWYCGCHTRVTRRYAPVQDYVALLEREMALVSATMSGAPVVRRVHWGGGTPNMLSPSDFHKLMARARLKFDVACDAEVAVEIDPRLLHEENAVAFAESGVTRASLGVQDFNEHVQRAVNRFQPFVVVAKTVDLLRRHGVDRFNLDLMYGLPEQSVEDLIRSVDLAVTLKPDRIALFGYAHVPWMKANQRKIDETHLPDTAERYAQAEAAACRLTEHGYVRVGLDHFCQPTDGIATALRDGRLRRNFQGYTTDTAKTLLGFGASAIGSLTEGYVQNAVPLREYSTAIGQGKLPIHRGIRLSSDDRLRRAVIERLMCVLTVDLRPLCACYGVDPCYFAGALAALQEMVDDGIVEISDTRLRIPEQARPLMRSVCATFDSYLAQGETRHSRAV